MVEIIRCAHVRGSKFEHVVISIEDLRDFPAHVPGLSKSFLVFLLVDGTLLDRSVFESFTVAMIGRGMVYFSVWGEQCEELEEAADEISVYHTIEHSMPDSHLITTSHSGESLDEALNFFVNSAIPDSRYQESCQIGVIVVVGNRAWTEELLTHMKERTSGPDK